jgi:hypothetical protein
MLAENKNYQNSVLSKIDQVFLGLTGFYFLCSPNRIRTYTKRLEGVGANPLHHKTNCTSGEIRTLKIWFLRPARLPFRHQGKFPHPEIPDE